MNASSPRMRMRPNAAGSAVLVALFGLLLAGMMAAALAELGRLSLQRARIGRDGVGAWFLAEAGLAETIAEIEPASHFNDLLAAAPGPLAESGAPGRYAIAVSDDVDDDPDDPTHDANGRVWLRLAAFGPPPIRRRLEAVLERDFDALFPGAVTLAGDLGELAVGFSLDGRDADAASGCTTGTSRPDRFGLAIPRESALPPLELPERINGRYPLPSIGRVSPADLTSLATSEAADRLVPGPLPSLLGDAASPRFSLVGGDALATGETTGGGLLYVSGRLVVSGSFVFTGVVVAAGGIEVTSSGHLDICGGVWAAGSPALATHGSGSIRVASDTIRTAARLAPLPARARAGAIAERF